jgi:hypothetical protein
LTPQTSPLKVAKKVVALNCGDTHTLQSKPAIWATIITSFVFFSFLSLRRSPPSSPFAGQLLSRYNPKICICTSLILNCFFTLVFAFSPPCTNAAGNCAGTYILLGSKICIGVSQACILVYLPVWVDEYAIPSLRTLWMSLLQAGIPLGVMFGYLMSGYLSDNGKGNPPFCHKIVPSYLGDCCGAGVAGQCDGEKFSEIADCCTVDHVTCDGVEWNLEQCCKPFDCPGGCWYCQWKYAIFFQVGASFAKSSITPVPLPPL